MPLLVQLIIRILANLAADRAQGEFFLKGRIATLFFFISFLISSFSKVFTQLEIVVTCSLMRNLLMCLIAFLASTVSFSQTIRGKVVEQQNQASLTGAVIIQKGTSNGVVTDYDGEFSIKVSGLPATLVVKYVGFAEQEVEILKDKDCLNYGPKKITVSTAGIADKIPLAAKEIG